MSQWQSCGPCLEWYEVCRAGTGLRLRCVCLQTGECLWPVYALIPRFTKDRLNSI